MDRLFTQAQLDEAVAGAFEAAAETADAWAEAGGHIGTVGEHIRAHIPPDATAALLRRDAEIVCGPIPAASQEFCKDCGRKMVWQNKDMCVWMCPHCVMERCLRAELKLGWHPRPSNAQMEQARRDAEQRLAVYEQILEAGISLFDESVIAFCNKQIATLRKQVGRE
jgi:hypothetical protein